MSERPDDEAEHGEQSPETPAPPSQAGQAPHEEQPSGKPIVAEEALADASAAEPPASETATDHPDLAPANAAPDQAIRDASEAPGKQALETTEATEADKHSTAGPVQGDHETVSAASAERPQDHAVSEAPAQRSWYDLAAEEFARLEGPDKRIVGPLEGGSDDLTLLLDNIGFDFKRKNLVAAAQAVAADLASISLGEVQTIICLLTARSPTTKYLHKRYAALKPNEKFKHASGFLSPGLALSKAQNYLRSGRLDNNRKSAMAVYITKLDEHRKLCENAGRYPEARAAKIRLLQLKTEQARCMLSEVRQRHQDELELVNDTFLTSQRDCEEQFDRDIEAFEEAFSLHVEELRAKHDDEVEVYRMKMDERKPMRAHRSKQLINQREIQQRLGRFGEYTKAHKVQQAADKMEIAEMQQAMARYEAEWRLHEAKLHRRQQGDLEALLQKGARDRDALELRKLNVLQQHDRRWRNVVADLTQLQKAELTQLELFCENMAIGGKCIPQKESKFRKRALHPLF